MPKTTVDLITGDLSAAFPDGLTLTNAVLTTALATGSAIKTAVADTSTVLLQAYDVNGATYRTFGTLTAADVPTFVLSSPSGGTLTIEGAAIGGTTAAAGAFTTIAASGASTLAAISGTSITASAYFLQSVGNALTAVGTNRATALQLAKQVNNVTTAASGTGVILPVGVAGMRITIYNAGANAIQVYASASETIDTVAGSTGVVLTNTKRAIYDFVAANTWISAQLGVVSA